MGRWSRTEGQWYEQKRWSGTWMGKSETEQEGGWDTQVGTGAGPGTVVAGRGLDREKYSS